MDSRPIFQHCVRPVVTVLGRFTLQCEVLERIRLVDGIVGIRLTPPVLCVVNKATFERHFFPTLASPNFPYVYGLFVDSGNLAYDTVSGDVSRDRGAYIFRGHSTLD